MDPTQHNIKNKIQLSVGLILPLPAFDGYLTGDVKISGYASLTSLKEYSATEIETFVYRQMTVVVPLNRRLPNATAQHQSHRHNCTVSELGLVAGVSDTEHSVGSLTGPGYLPSPALRTGYWGVT
jgi:hypothetical protein